MDQTQLLALSISAGVGSLATLLILVRQRRERDEDAVENPFAASTEGEKRCPRCGMPNLWTDRECMSCRAGLPG